MTETRRPTYTIECKRLLYYCFQRDGVWVVHRDNQEFYGRVEDRAKELGRDLQADLSTLMDNYDRDRPAWWPGLDGVE